MANRPSHDDQSGEDKAHQAKVWRERLYYNAVASAALMVLFMTIIAGLVRHELTDIPSYVEPPQMLKPFRDWNGVIQPFHRVAGYALIVLFPLAGLLQIRLARLLKGGIRLPLRVSGLVTLIAAAPAVLVAMTTGYAMGEPTQAGTLAKASAVTVQSLDTDTAAAHLMHLQYSAFSLLIPSLMLLLGVSLISLPGVRQQAGISKKKRSA